MKIILKYQAPETNLNAYKFSAVYETAKAKEAVAELKAARRVGYEITLFQLVPDEDVKNVL